MKTICKPLELNLNYDIRKIGPPEELLFFDIETTGLSAFDSSIYLIGTIAMENGTFVFRQWFSESLSDEISILKDFFRYIEPYSTLVTFNGESFDIKYINDTARQYGMHSSLTTKNSFDIYKAVRSVRKQLQLDHCKQKCIEHFLGIDREDVYTGGELIEIYKEYITHPTDRYLKFLLLHNEEDVIGMTEILPVLQYVDVFRWNPDVSTLSQWCLNSRYRFNEEAKTLDIVLVSNLSFPTSLSLKCKTVGNSNICIQLKEDRILIRIPYLEGELKYFYPNYKDYYYLPEEGITIHKKLATFVDADHKIPASRENCYSEAHGKFIPHFKGMDVPVFQEKYHDEKKYMNFDESLIGKYISILFKNAE